VIPLAECRCPRRAAGGTGPVNRIGHQGLFFERLTGAIGDPALLPSDPSIPRTVRGLYHSRNRWLHVELGRFLTRDPAEAAIPIITAFARHGRAWTADVAPFDPVGHYGDGGNLYEFVGSDPVNRIDPLGLQWGLEEEIDDLIADRTGHAMYALATLNEGAKWASLGLQTTLSIAWSLLPGSGLYDAFQSIEVLANGKGGFWEALDIATAAFPLAGRALEGVTALRGLFKGRSWGFKACNCFVQGTMVATPTGPVPIEHIQPDEDVLTVDQDQPEGPLLARHVTSVLSEVAPVIVWLLLDDAELVGTTPGHEVWTRRQGWTFAWQLRVGDQFAGLDGNAHAITGLFIDRTPTTVYNLEVDDTHTYFAQGTWVHNTSGCSWSWVRRQFWGGAAPKRVAKVRYADGTEGYIEVTAELHHVQGRGIANPHDPSNLVPLWPWEHAMIDPSRHVNYTFLGWFD
jgi:hypothetical protein